MPAGDHEKLDDYRAIFRRLFNPQAAQVALLDLQGVIIETNTAWNRYGSENGIAASYHCVGTNYLKICEEAASRNDPSAQQAYLGLLEVIHARRPKFTMVYPCHEPTSRRWYRMWVEPQLPQVPAIVVAHYQCATDPIEPPDKKIQKWLGGESHYQA